MLAPLALVAAIGWLTPSWLTPGRRVFWAVVMLGVMGATTRPADWGRVPWSARYGEVRGLPTLPEDSMVLMVGRGALSFLIPAFPRGGRFVRIESWFTKPEDDNGLTRLMHGTVAAHGGPLPDGHGLRPASGGEGLFHPDGFALRRVLFSLRVVPRGHPAFNFLKIILPLKETLCYPSNSGHTHRSHRRHTITTRARRCR
ncbi:MAG: hypothetical protein FD149_1789 [Rhodospirillaceae bacterium]|nr:MAG: hypothetical protein FD149_1789 [Rhodospirillaceae bacterium]